METRISEAALQTVTAKELKYAIRSMNPVTKKYGMAVAPKGNKNQLAAAFMEGVAHVVAADEKGLDLFVDAVKNMNLLLTATPGTEDPADGDQGNDTAQNGTGTKVKAAKPKPAPKPKARTRGQAFVEVLRSGFGPATRKQWAEEYEKNWLRDHEPGKNRGAEENFRCNVYMDILTALGLMKAGDGNVYEYVGE